MSRREFLPLKRFVDAHRPITYGIVQAGEDVEDGVPYIRPIDMDEHNGVRDPAALRKTAREIAAAYTRSTVRPGDLVVSIGPSYGKTMIVSSELDGANLTQGTARIAPGPDVEASFIRWALRSSTATEFWDAAVAGATFRALNLEPLSRTPVPAWTLREQRGISDFLDAATARINALVEKKRHMLGLVEHRFQTLVGQTVTRGLEADAPMRDSGVEWIGRVPSEWQVARIRHLSTVRRGASPRPIDDPVYFDDDGAYAWVRISDVTAAGRYLYKTEQMLSELGADKSIRLDPGELFVSIAATVGKPIITRIKCCIHDGFVYFDDLRLNREFLYYVLASGLPYGGLGKLGTQLNLNTDTIGDIAVPVPSVDEQVGIVEFLESELARRDRTARALAGQINLLREHRQALITAAVTGELDVAAHAA